ncbi:hypothetical protein CBS101457_002883 [Exobasidium rhododendri]|nr:hypothetical protein CBS101457_002883 [Exobasidium rhododendri]
MTSSDGFLEQRLRHFTWAWFTVPMSTGGISLILGQLPFRFKGLDSIGLLFYMTDVLLFFSIVLAMILRYTITSASVYSTLQHPIEGLFLPTAQLAFATLLMGMSRYSQPDLNPWCADVLLVCFWIYVAIATVQAPLQYWSLFAIKTQRNNHTTRQITPGILLPIFPSMLVGATANAVSKHQNPDQALNVVIAGVAFQGLGILVTCFLYALLLHRLIQYGLPEPSHRTGLFICAGPPAFCGLALLGMARNAHSFLPSKTISSTDVSDVLFIMGLVTAVFLWQLAAFWWLLAAISVLSGIRSKHFHFSMSWWAAIFPICGFCICTIYIGQALDSHAILWFATGMAVYLIVAYFVVMTSMIEAILSRKIMWEGKDEDKDIALSSRREDVESLSDDDTEGECVDGSFHDTPRKEPPGNERDTRQAEFKNCEAITRSNSFDEK